MIRILFTLTLLLSFSNSFSQWTRVQQLPSTNIFTLFHKDSVLYAAGTNVIYVSNNKGQTWDSTTAIPKLSSGSSMISHIIVYKNELYAAGDFTTAGGVASKNIAKWTGSSWSVVGTASGADQA